MSPATFEDLHFRLAAKQKRIAKKKREAKARYGAKSNWPEGVKKYLELLKADCRYYREKLGAA